VRGCVNATIPRHERAVLTAWPPAQAGRHAGHRPQRIAARATLRLAFKSSKPDLTSFANFSRTPPSRPRASARSVAPDSRPRLCQPRIPEDRKERSASAVRKRICRNGMPSLRIARPQIRKFAGEAKPARPQWPEALLDSAAVEGQHHVGIAKSRHRSRVCRDRRGGARCRGEACIAPLQVP
jgi:hypothetical protein